MGCEKSLNWIKERDEHCGCKFCKGEWNSSWDSLKWMFNFHSQFTPQPHTIVRSYWKVEIEKEMQEHNWDLLCLLNTAQLRKCDEWIRIRKKVQFEINFHRNLLLSCGKAMEFINGSAGIIICIELKLKFSFKARLSIVKAFTLWISTIF